MEGGTLLTWKNSKNSSDFVTGWVSISLAFVSKEGDGNAKI